MSSQEHTDPSQSTGASRDMSPTTDTASSQTTGHTTSHGGLAKTAQNFIKKVTGDKKAWRAMEARANALPQDYRFVYHSIQHYMWGHASGDGMDMLPVFCDLLEMFETGAAEGRQVLGITGEDVAGFCDELLSNTRTWDTNRHDALNRDIKKELAKKDTLP